MDLEKILSDTEEYLYNFIKDSEELVTIKLIEEELSKNHTGALGKLLSLGLIEKRKKKSDSVKKSIRYYAIKEQK